MKRYRTHVMRHIGGPSNDCLVQDARVLPTEGAEVYLCADIARRDKEMILPVLQRFLDYDIDAEDAETVSAVIAELEDRKDG